MVSEHTQDEDLSTQHKNPDVFISYSSQDREKVLGILQQLKGAQVSTWIDQSAIEGGTNYGPEIVQGIKYCKVLLLMVSEASMRSHNVRQEIQLAWKYRRPFLPLLLDDSVLTGYPEQVAYWLEGVQWIDVTDKPVTSWLPQVLRSLSRVKVQSAQTGVNTTEGTGTAPVYLDFGLEGLMALAKFNDQMWPIPAEQRDRSMKRSGLRDLGEAQDNVAHGFRIGDRVSIIIESDREGHLLLLDKGTTGKIFCLCPSHFAPKSDIVPGRTYLPLSVSRYDSFAITGKPGREQLIALITKDPLPLDWMPLDPKIPAKLLSPGDIRTLLQHLQQIEGDRWIALSTYFDVKA